MKTLFIGFLILICGSLLMQLVSISDVRAAQDQAWPEGRVRVPKGCRLLMASWYSIESLKKEGTYKYSKGVMANGKNFDENNLTCATRLFPLGSSLFITNLENGKKVVVLVTDRIGKRFTTKRIDLSKLAFSRIAELKRGVVAVKVERIKR